MRVYWLQSKLCDISHITMKGRKSKPIAKELEDIIIQDYFILKSMRKVASKHKIAEKRIISILNAYNIQHDKSGNKARKYSLDERFFEKYADAVMGPCVVYWLGFIVADGNVYSNSEQRVYALTIELGEEDKEHLIKIREALSSNAIITTSIRKGGFRAGKLWKDSIESKIVFHSKYLTNTLMHLGIMPAKSKIITFPPKLIDNQFINSFVRGYLDGDGSISFKKNTLRVNFYGTFLFLETLSKIIHEKTAVSLHKPFKNRTIFNLEYNGAEAQQIIKWIYQEQSPSLQRKYELIKKYL